MKLGLVKILIALMAAVSCLTWSHFYSWGFANPWWTSDISLPLAPLTAAVTLFAWLIFDKGQFLADARESLDRQLNRYGSVVLALFATISCISLVLTSNLRPPKWEELIDNALLSGYDDSFSRASQIQALLLEENSEFSTLISISIELEGISREQSNWVEAEKFGKLNELQQRLSVVEISSGYEENLKSYSLALLNEAFLRLDYFENNRQLISENIAESLNSILNSDNKYQTDLLASLCKRMSGNNYYQMGDVASAISFWEELDPSPNVYANLNVGYRDLGSFAKAQAASDAGFALIDAGLEEDSLSEASLVANTMATLMHMQQLDQAIGLYRERYVDRGKTSDSALLQQYALLLILNGEVSSAEALILDGSFLDDEVGYVNLLISLHKGRAEEALMIATNTLGVAEANMEAENVWGRIEEDFDSAGYLGNERLREYLDWAKINAI